MTAAAWQRLGEELDAWGEAGRTATLWWRDDDATRPGPALNRLLALAGNAGVPLALAVIPATAETGLGDLLRARPDIAVLHHGYAHINHAGDGEKKAELGAQRPLAVRLDELATGRARLSALLARALPVLTPPWNRIDADLVAHLPDAGFLGLSTFGARAAAHPQPGITQVNCHVDIIDWRKTRAFAGEDVVLDALTSHLAARRGARVDQDEPTGLLTHHDIHDSACWAFIATLLRLTGAHPAVRWRAAETLFFDLPPS